MRRLVSWNDEAARDFAAACADHVLPIFEGQRPDEDRPRHAIELARLFALGAVTAGELAKAWRAVRDLVENEARGMSGDALASLRAAAWSAASPDQSRALLADEAAREAQKAAAWAGALAAARTQREFERGSPHTAQWSWIAAAWRVAEARERAWQAQRLVQYLDAEPHEGMRGVFELSTPVAAC